MRILKLSTSNVKRISAVEITPEGDVIVISGKNGAGKSSVLDSIMYALGGKETIPSEPIRQGEAEAKIELDLGEYLVTRKFRRDKVYEQCEGPADETGPKIGVLVAHNHTPNCKWHWGETKSTIVVKNKEDAVYQSPQALLDKLLGALTFDPLEFATDKPAAQNTILRTIARVDTTLLDSSRKTAFDKRADATRRLKTAEAAATTLPHFPDAPAVQTTLSDISESLVNAERLRRAADDIDNELNRETRSADEFKRSVAFHTKEIERLMALVGLEQRKLEAAKQELHALETVKLPELKTKAEAARAAVPNVAEIQQSLKVAEDVNSQVRANQYRTDALANLEKLKTEVAQYDAEVQKIDQEKLDMVHNAKYPVPGLGINDDGVTWNDVPFEQASTADKIRVSVAIGRSLNPKLRVLLIREGSALDKASMKLLADEAATHDLQLWIERVAETKEGAAVLIEDGHLG